MLAILLAIAVSQAAIPERPKPFSITIVDEETGRGVPLVELETVNKIRFVTDSAGVVAFDEPGLLGLDVHFSIRSFGYTFPKDGFGIAGRTLKTQPGGAVELKIHRKNLAERLYRTTGGGIYRDSVLVGKTPPIAEPLLNAQVLGQDSIQSVVLGDEILWFWGDTNKPSYPLGNFHMPVASSLPPSPGGLDPEVGINLVYEKDKNGFARAGAMMPGDGPTWLGGLTVLRDEDGKEHLFAVYDKIRNMLETYQRGLVEWDPKSREFHKLREFPLSDPLYPRGHPFLHEVDGVKYVYFPTPLPLSRVRADIGSFLDFSKYEAFTPYCQGQIGQKPEIERDDKGHVVYGWKPNTRPAEPADLTKLVSQGLLAETESAYSMRDIETGKAITPHGGSVNWNPYRNRWVMVFVAIGGKSMLGEVYFAEADSPLGPWTYARKVVTHSGEGEVYSFYNPKHHLFLDQDSGRTIYFEGTYTATFSGNTHPTPRYDYNQIMYKLDLTKTELALPVPVYLGQDGRLLGPADSAHRDRGGHPVAFYAYDHAVPGSTPVSVSSENVSSRRLTTGAVDGEVLFHALPPDGPETLDSRRLKEFRTVAGEFRYLPEDAPAVEGLVPTGQLLCRVWRSPSRIVLPRE